MVLRQQSIPQAWAEGYLAYRRGESRRACPYLEGSDTAELWQAGWALGFVRDAGPLSEGEHRWRHVLDKHLPDRDAWPSRGWRP
jgi:ribosome modulation factor